MSTESKRRLILLVRVGVSSGVIVYLFTLLDWNRVWEVVSTLNFGYLWMPPVITASGLLFAAIRWSALLPYFRIRLRKRDSFGLYLIGSFYNNIMPGAIGGDVVRGMLCAVRTNKPVASIMASILLERTCGIVVLCVLPWLAVALISERAWKEVLPVISILVWVCVIGAILVVGGWLALKVLPRWRGYVLRYGYLGRKVIRGAELLRAVPSGTLVLVLLLSLGLQLADVVGTYVLVQAMNLDVSLAVLLLFIPLVYVATLLPISLGGVGVREGALTLLFGTIGVMASDAVTLAFLVYLNRVLVGLVGGALQLVWNVVPMRPLDQASESGGGVRGKL